MTITVKTDEYIELIGVIAYLRGDFWYNKGDKNTYMEDIDKYFHLYKKHPVIKKYKAISTNKLFYIASLLEYKRGKFVIKKEQGNSNLCMLGMEEQVLEKSEELLELLADFYKSSLFHKFFKKHEDFYEKIRVYYDNLVHSLDTDWFRCFFGDEENHLFSIIPISISQHEAYGLCRHLEGIPKEHIALLCQPGFSATVVEEQTLLTMIIHEYLHSFVNPLLYRNIERQKKFQSEGLRLLEFSKWTMQRQGYADWRILVNEYLVRAITNIYMQDNKFKKQAIKSDIMDNIGRGFYLMPELIGYLNKYRFCRDKYNKFDDFYSEIIKFFSSYNEKEMKRVDDILRVILEI